ncbi:MAG TPA: ABC transporter permease [Bdellovibrionales bacterium]|jgi:phospholipid/cholesterol/gamma-HCH transport system permease protein|nr:ABC transporter permease [Bdellovibrionales bacterium]
MIDALGGGLITLGKYSQELLGLMKNTFKGVLTPPFRVRDTIQQFYFIANQSVFIIIVCVSFAAVVTIIESSFHMKIVIQNDSLVPGFAAMLILRELGSVVMALLLTSRVGAGIAAEVGTMKITEQIDALKMLGLDPVRFIVVPRFIASVAAGFVLAIIANLVCLFFAMLVSTMKLGSSFGAFITAMNAFVGFQDLVFAGIKGAVFGAVIPLFSCFYGFRCRAGAEGVGLATTNSVVATSVAIIVLDFVLTYVFSYMY